LINTPLRFALLLLLLASCAAPSKPPLPPGKLFEGDYLNVKAPDAPGWSVIGSSPGGMAFAKQGRERGETTSALVSMFDLPPTDTPEAFVAAISEGIRKNTDPKRFDIIDSSLDYTTERAYPCARHYSLVTDKQAALLLEMRGLYCRHPVRTRTGFAAIYSHRGSARDPNLAQEAQAFIQGVQVPAAGAR
jgi:hypothetical protein